MSVIQKLLIQGIRSVDPGNQVVIEFYSPLTIIVGQNGCGKTTIIESLKYITTGELPPNSKGGAFIHDPKLLGENEVKAQVKLKFRDTQQMTMKCVRSMLATQKKSTVTLRTLDGTLSIDGTSTKEGSSHSLKSSELDTLMPQYLGVSKAVLENVIFCHQEESNWPLSEPSNLKKRFDEIFAASGYTKALDKFKAYRKDQSVDIRLLRGELKHLEEKKLKAERVRVEYEKSTVSIHKYRERIEDIQQQETLVTSQIEALAGQLQEFMRLQTTVEGLKMNLEQKIASYKEMEASTNVLTVSDEELERMNADVSRQIDSQESDLESKRAERDSLQKLIDELQDAINNTLADIGRLRAAQDSLETKVTGRADTVKDLCAVFEVSIDVSQDKEQQAHDCAHALETLLSGIETERAAMRQRFEETEQKLQADINATQSEIFGFANAAKVSEQQTAANLEQIHSLEQKRLSIHIDSAKQKMLEEEMAAETKQLELAQAKSSSDTYNESAKQKRMELSGVIDEIERLNTEISRNNRQADVRAKLALERKSLKDKNEQRKVLLNTEGLDSYARNGQAFACERERTSAISAAIEAKKLAIADCNSRSKSSYDSLTSCKLRLKLARQSYEDQAKDIAQKTDRIRAVCDPAQFDEIYADTQSEMHELMEEAGQWKSVSSMYKAYIKKIESDHSCPVCQRSWSNQDDESRIVNKLKIDYTSAPTELIKTESDIRDCQRRLDELANLKASVQDVRHWNDRGKSELDSQIKELAAKEEQVRTEADDAECEGVALAVDLENITGHLEVSQKLAQLEEAVSASQALIEQLEHELQATGSTKTIDELQAEVTKCQSQESAIRRELDRLSQEHVLQQKEVGFRQDSIRNLQNKLDQFKQQQSEHESISQRIAELESANVANTSSAKELRLKAEQLAPQLEQNQRRLAEFRNKVRSDESEVDQRARKIMQSRDRLKLISDEIEQVQASLRCEPENDEYPDRLAMANAKRESLQEEVSASSQKLAAVDKALQESDRLAVKLSAKQRELSDNIRLRANIAEQERIKAELKTAQESQAKLESQLSQIYDDNADDAASASDDDVDLISGVSRKRRHRGGNGGHGAAKRRGNGGARLQERRNVLNAKLSELTSERAGLQGEVKQLEDQARRLSRELSTEYKDVDKLYVRQLVQCRTEELANSDTEKFTKALDAAIMRYHSLKMQDINKIIRELWLNTYQGNDIDTIEIRSEIEGARSTRSHNYRVVMIKGGNAIDMRGRCSAGQKVLACLIIRMALAETFSVNCGILALDEPTTNLDQENIDSLAHSLARIIKSRQGQRNFQLIVITHDETFMQLLGRSEYADNYWRVLKDDNQCSVFVRRPIAGHDA
ncbi:DNA repair protein rad50 [Coemansia sp. RSA 989]|nr:DNA repair protein rad50 [Coemansia sp. RSA 989]KAJ1875031.1 DNA repair protein rad50 [Coemansia sp. RSA 990]